MIHPSEMSARQWREWVEFCAKENKIDRAKLSGTKSERDEEYEKAWALAVTESSKDSSRRRVHFTHSES